MEGPEPMNCYLIDTDVLIDHLRGTEKARDYLRRLVAEGSVILCCRIGKAEICSGACPEEESSVALLFASMDEVPVDGDIGCLGQGAPPTQAAGSLSSRGRFPAVET